MKNTVGNTTLIVLSCGFICEDCALCPKCPGNAKIWPASALRLHLLVKHHPIEEVKKRRGRSGRAYGVHDRFHMSSTGVEKKEGIHAA
jgi:hypothetical protein